MDSLLPIITVTDLQRSTKSALAGVRDYAIVRSHNKDVALVLHPDLGRALLNSDVFQKLLAEVAERRSSGDTVKIAELDTLIGQVLRELSKK